MTNYRDFSDFALLMQESALDYHDPEIIEEICRRAELLEEWNSADGETFESVIDRAIEILKEGL